MNKLSNDNQHNKEVFSSNLLFYLNKKNIMQKDLAKYLGISQSSVTDWVKTRTYPRMDKIQAIANYFCITVSDLIEEKNRISIEEQKILDLYSEIPEDKKDIVIKFLESLR